MVAAACADNVNIPAAVHRHVFGTAEVADQCVDFGRGRDAAIHRYNLVHRMVGIVGSVYIPALVHRHAIR